MILDNIHTVQEKVRQVCLVLGRNVSDITIVLVTKNVGIDCIKEAYNAGIRTFGENKVQEFEKKIHSLPDDIQWHFVGHLQTNKVKHIINKVCLIHSVDRLKLALEIEKQADKHNKIMNVLIQVNTSHESTKSGVDEGELETLIREMKIFKHIAIKGLMTIGPFTSDTKKIRDCFITLRLLREQMQQKFSDVELPFLSMGMSADYVIALEEGANMLRIGTAIFGERMYT